MSEIWVTKHLLPEKQAVCKVSHLWGIVNFNALYAKGEA